MTDAPSKKPLRDHAPGVLATTRLPPDAIGFRGILRAMVIHLGLAAAIVCVAEPALAKIVVKKGVYGAIALQRETGQLGYAYNGVSSRVAKMEALNQCAHPRCEVVAAFSNACGALARQPARGPKGYFPATGAVRQEAETKALRLCASGECEIVAWACTK